jgi:hypothetical protein
MNAGMEPVDGNFQINPIKIDAFSLSFRVKAGSFSGNLFGKGAAYTRAV